jgi:hypothetical protein
MPIMFNEKVIAGTVNGAVVTYTHQLPDRHAFSVQATWTGTPITGQLKLQASLNGTDFIDMTDSLTTFDAAGQVLWDISKANYKYLKIWCESLTGDVTFGVWLTLKRDSGLR